MPTVWSLLGISLLRCSFYYRTNVVVTASFKSPCQYNITTCIPGHVKHNYPFCQVLTCLQYTQLNLTIKQHSLERTVFPGQAVSIITPSIQILHLSSADNRVVLVFTETLCKVQQYSSFIQISQQFEHCLKKKKKMHSNKTQTGQRQSLACIAKQKKTET